MNMKARFLASVILILVHGAAFGQERWFDGEATVRLWKQGHSAEHHSPIYTESPSSQARKQVLTGRIIVEFKVPPSDGGLSTFAQRYRLAPIKKMNLGTAFYLFQSADVASSLEIANRIYLSGEVSAAYPDWLYLLDR
jgi:hypothetical protein